MDEILPNILAGVFLIIIGLLIKRFPILIAGYNTMSAEKKKNVDVEGLSSFMRRHFVIIGALWIATAVLLHITKQTNALSTIYIIYMPIYAIWMMIRSQRYDHNKK